MKAKITLIFTLATLIYAVIGGVIFHYIEQGYENDLLPQVLQELNQYTTDGKGDACLNWTDFNRLKGIVDDLNDGGYYISSSGQLVNSTKWDVQTSIFAAISVFTSVGFNKLAPDYTWSRLFCIFYSLLGIPVYFSAITTTGKLGRRAIKVVGRRLCGRNVPKRAGWIIANIVAFVIGFVLFMLIPAVIFSHLERWNYAESIYFCFSTLFTIGFSDYTPGFNNDVDLSDEFLRWYRLAIGFWIILLIFWYGAYLDLVQEKTASFAEKAEEIAAEKLRDKLDMLAQNQNNGSGLKAEDLMTLDDVFRNGQWTTVMTTGTRITTIVTN